MDQKHTSGNGTVCMFFLIKLLKSCKKYHRKKKYLPVVKLLNLRRPLGEKSLGLGYPSPVQEEVFDQKRRVWFEKQVDHRIWFKSAMMEIERCFSSHLMDSYLSLSLSAFLDWEPFNKGNFCTNGLLHWYLRKKRTGKIR